MEVYHILEISFVKKSAHSTPKMDRKVGQLEIVINEVKNIHDILEKLFYLILYVSLSHQ